MKSKSLNSACFSVKQGLYLIVSSAFILYCLVIVYINVQKGEKNGFYTSTVFLKI